MKNTAQNFNKFFYVALSFSKLNVYERERVATGSNVSGGTRGNNRRLGETTENSIRPIFHVPYDKAFQDS